MAGQEGGPEGGGGGGGQEAATRPVTIQAAGPAVLAGQTLLVPARDGSLLAFDKDLGVDLTAPRVALAFPNAGDQVSGQRLELIFRIDDEATGVKADTLRVELDGKPLKHELTRDGFIIVRISPGGENRPLQDGRKNITVIVSDWIGNETRAMYSVTVDNSISSTVRPASGGTNPPGGGGVGGGGLGGDGR